MALMLGQEFHSIDAVVQGKGDIMREEGGKVEEGRKGRTRKRGTG